jgi:hypothetical protein
MKRIRFLAAIAFALVALAARGAAGREPELQVAFSVMGYGYSVKVLVNGADTGVQGGKSESKGLFTKGHAMMAKAPPNVRASHALLRAGANDIAIEYSKLASRCLK